MYIPNISGYHIGMSYHDLISKQILMVVERYAAVMDTTPCVACVRIIGDKNFYKTLRNGTNYTLLKADRFIANTRVLWPDEAPWPKRFPTPDMSKATISKNPKENNNG